jgi:ubiquinone/menaquinone biosynthesis C-methylase UbiE
MNVRKRWFAWAYRYVDRLQRPTTARIRRALVGDLRGYVLDVGCGPGTNFRYYAPDAHVVALDYNEYMLPMARAEAARLEGAHEQIEVRHADATALPFPDGSFDAYVSTLVLCSVSDLERAVDEAWRVLRPGGQLRVFEHVRSSSPWIARVQRWLSPAWGVVADGCRLDQETDAAFRARGFQVEEDGRPRVLAEPFPLIVLRARKPVDAPSAPPSSTP